MKSLCYHFAIVLLLFVCCWLMSGFTSQLHAQGAVHFYVNSTADDEFAYAWDDTLTPDVDESRDGICGDEKGRCTLRAAIMEAWNMSDNGVPCDINIAVWNYHTYSRTHQSDGLVKNMEHLWDHY